MEFFVKRFSDLTTTELYALLHVRNQVFVVEQDCVYQDLDEIDYDSLHVFGYENEKIVAYLRTFIKDSAAKTAQIGRVLTTKRNAGFGRQIFDKGIFVAKEYLKAKTIYIEAQCYAIGFYEKAGFQIVSEEFLEDGIPHVKMELKTGL